MTTTWKCFTSPKTDGTRTASISFKDFAWSLMVSIGLKMANVLIKKQVTLRTNSPLYPTGSSTNISMEIGKLQDRSALIWNISKNTFIKPYPSQSNIFGDTVIHSLKVSSSSRGFKKSSYILLEWTLKLYWHHGKYSRMPRFSWAQKVRMVILWMLRVISEWLLPRTY